MRRRDFIQSSLLVAASGISRRALALQSSTNIVVVGGGFAGSACALHLRRLNPALTIHLIDPDERYVTCPMSNSALVGLRSMASITITRSGLARAGVNYVRDRVTAVDTKNRQIRTAGGTAMGYDKLVIAPGIRFLWARPEGYDEAASRRMPHAWRAGEQTSILSTQLRQMRNGGVIAISVPAGPMRCPPGPFERASLIAGYLKQHKPRSKVLIFDANNHFPKQEAFTDAWKRLYPGMIEWIPVVDGGAITRVDPAQMTLYTSLHSHKVDVANIIPPQAPGLLAAATGLASDHGWCPVKPASFESTLIADVHVIGDACIAGPMPKSASAANSQARQCALAIVTLLADQEPTVAAFENVCYSLLATGDALSIHGHFRLNGDEIDQMPESAEKMTGTQEAANAERWYTDIVADSFNT